MRSDYGLYVAAVICLIIAGIFLTGTVAGYTLEDPMGPAAIVIFAILGVILAIAGYTIRPKAPIPTVPTTPQTLPEPSAPPSLPPIEEKVEEPQTVVEQAPPQPSEPVPTIEETAPTPAPTVEEPAKVEEEKPVRRRRKKKTA